MESQAITKAIAASSVRGAPYLIIKDQDNPDLMAPVIGFSEYGSQIIYCLAENRLVLGKDLREVDTKKLELFVTTSGEKWCAPVINAARNFARVSGHEFVSLKIMGDNKFQVIGPTSNGDHMLRIAPRLFERIEPPFVKRYR